MTEIKISPLPPRVKPLSGEWGRLTVLGFDSVRKRKAFFWVKCECGNVASIRSDFIKMGHTRSCGCLLVGGNNSTHGMTHTREYRCWQAILNRCRLKSNTGYKNYGGRGIKCKFDTFEEFYAEVGPRPSAKHSIDRIDNNGHYEPFNVRWATAKQQQRNRRNNVLLTYDGRTQPISAWAEEFGVRQTTFGSRIKAGWSVEDAVSRPIQTRN